MTNFCMSNDLKLVDKEADTLSKSENLCTKMKKQILLDVTINTISQYFSSQH